MNARTTLAALVIGLMAALGFGTAAAPAQAAPGGVQSGTYWFHSPGYFGQVNHNPAVVRGNTLTVRYGPLVYHYPLIKTPNGAYFDNRIGTRMTLTKKGNRHYAGTIYYYGIDGGKVSLTKR
ncbi:MULTISPECIES: hypothetical protein [Mycobacteriales]|uniref:Uncharacterized protein n=1 Tax=Gordonia amicalis TaxID=89053 RepID=A0ABU4DEB0_9ACTN|nr:MULTISPECIES: hypothetical protein [Mycobacteriales]KHJ71272.1 hypothetical protein QR64_18145 [Rhodococcus sp. Chr-9]MDV6308084.1 hypothetical protein [Gordonia amicalis]